MTTRVFGHVPGVSVGSAFGNRRELSAAGVHRPLMAGISGAPDAGADSVVVSGGYEDDEDRGDEVVYTGHGGRDPATGRQVADQRLERQNLALARSCLDGRPVRVVRGAGGNPDHAPPVGYRYDGLYRVADFWTERGRSGHLVARFRLVRDPGGEARPAAPAGAGGRTPPQRVATVVQRIVRSTAAAQRVKEAHGFRCQVCGVVVETAAGPYAEAAHVRPLGAPHHGPDAPGNVLCLCPTDHVRFDHGALLVTDAGEVVEAATGAVLGRLRAAPGHRLGMDHLAYHRRLWQDSRADLISDAAPP